MNRQPKIGFVRIGIRVSKYEAAAYCVGVLRSGVVDNPGSQDLNFIFNIRRKGRVRRRWL